jgi:PTH1 family peptidyl-tRNA hydrolase
MHLVVGLGNPGKRYALTRHNAGFMAVDTLSSRTGADCSRSQFGALVDRTDVSSNPVVLAKPQSFMNRSGQPVASLKGYYKVDAEQVVVVHDELDLPFGTVKVKLGGGHGGHNGLRDIMKHFSGKDFVRVRVGVSRPPPGWDVANYVLAPWTGDEQDQLEDVMRRAADAVEVIVSDGAKSAMNQINQRRSVTSEAPSANSDAGSLT